MSGVLTVSTAQLKQVTLLSVFTELELSALLQCGKVIQPEAYSNVVIEGELSWGMYLVVQGQVGIYKVNKLSGNVYEVGQLQAGSFFGEMSLIDQQPRSATVQTLTDCTLFFIGKSDFLQVVQATPGLKERFHESCIQQLVGRLRALNDDYVVSQYQLWKNALKLGQEAA